MFKMLSLWVANMKSILNPLLKVLWIFLMTNQRKQRLLLKFNLFGKDIQLEKNFLL